MSTRPPRVLVVGGGYVGMYTALRLLRRLRPGEASVTVVDPRSYMTYQPFLPEAAAGSIQPRHVVVPLRRVLGGADVITGAVTRVDLAARTAEVMPLEGEAFTLAFDQLVVAVGSVSRTLPIPGLAEVGTGFKTVEEAIQLRNRVVECLDIAESTRDPAVRARNLSFVVVGGGYAGIEALGELQDMCTYATRYYPSIAAADPVWHLVEASGRILPEVSEGLGRYTLDQLRQRGIVCHLDTRLESCVDGHVVLSDGTQLEAETLVWTAGVRPAPVVADLGLPLDERGRVRCEATMAVVGAPGVWAAGDAAGVPDLTQPGQVCAPSAQHAVRQAGRLGDNVVAALRGQPPQEYRHSYAGSVASLGLYRGVAEIYGVRLRGFPAWFMHRTYHVSRVPTLARKVQVVADWTQGLFFSRDVVSLWSMHDPFRAFTTAATQTATPAGVRPHPADPDLPPPPAAIQQP